jgi:3-oxoacyl-[acyl-carrier protein] reductase
LIDLTGKIAVITGAARGIGETIALRLAAAGCHVTLSDVLPDPLQTVAGKIEEMKGTALCVKADVAVIAEVEKLIQTAVEKFGRVDILVNNAGITRDNLVMRMNEAEWDSVIAINLKGTFNCIKAITRTMMKQRSGKIINIASVVGVIGNAGQANYAASKAGIIGLTKSVAKEFGSRNIQVNAVAPGYIETDMTASLPQEIKDAFLNSVPLKRPGSPDDVANAVLFLACPLSDYITGQVIHVDGGMVM